MTGFFRFSFFGDGLGFGGVLSIRLSTLSRFVSESLMVDNSTPSKPIRKPRLTRGQVAKLKYEQALGGFIAYFSLAEHDLQALLWRIAGVQTPVAQAIFSGTRVKEGISYVRRIHEARNSPMPTLLDEALVQLGIINEIRNTILHHGASFVNTEELEISNRLFAFNERVLKTHLIKLSTFNDLREDVARICLILRYTLHELTPNPGAWIYDWKNDELFHEPWQYKQPEQARIHRKNRLKNESQQPQRKSSRA